VTIAAALLAAWLYGDWRLGQRFDDGAPVRVAESAASFRRHEQLLIRGRVEPVDVYALPLAAAV